MSNAKLIVRISCVTQSSTVPSFNLPEMKILELVLIGVSRFSSSCRTKRFLPFNGRNQFDDASAYIGWLNIHGYISETEYNEMNNLIGALWEAETAKFEAALQLPLAKPALPSFKFSDLDGGE